MKAMILAAGFGTRMKPFTDIVAKPALPLLNVPIIRHNIAKIAQVGIKELIINLHHLPQTIKDAVDGYDELEVSITFVEEEQILGTGGGLKNAQKIIGDQTLLLINADIFHQVPLGDVIKFHIDHGGQATMVLLRAEEAEFPLLGATERLKINDFLGQRFTDHEIVHRGVFTGIHILEPMIFDYIPEGRFYEINQRAYPAMLREFPNSVNAFMYQGYWTELGDPKRYLQAHYDILKNPMLMSPTYNYAQPRGVHITEIMNLDNGSVLYPPSFIGEELQIGASARIGPYAFIGEKVNIEDDVVISHAVVMEGVKTEKKGSYRNGIFAWDKVNNRLVEHRLD